MTVSKKKLDSLAYYDQIKNANELKDGIDESYDQKRGFWYDPTGSYSHCFNDGEKIDLVPEGGTSSLRMFCTGTNPKTGEQLVSQKAGKTRRPGYDMTQSAPKWLSVLWSQSDAETRQKIESMVIQAAKEGVNALNQFAGSTTSGAQGRDRIGCVYSGAIFLDVTGRPVDASGNLLPEEMKHVRENQAYSLGEHSGQAFIDPQLHCHTIIPNVVLCADGRYRKVEGSILYQWQGVMAESFHASLANQLQAAGFAINNETEKVAFAIEGIPEAAVSGFSKRSGQIERNKAAENFDAVKDSAIAEKLLQKIKTDGRRAHTTATKDEIEEQWRERGKLYGFDKEAASVLIEEAKRRVADGIEFKKPSIADAREVLNKLLENESVISDAKFRAACLGMFTGGGSVAEINAIVDHIAEDAVELGKEGSTKIISTAEMVRIERELVEIAGTYKQPPPWSQKAVQEAIRSNYESMLKESGKRMSAQQIRAAHYLLDSDDGIVNLEGRAGSGKSFLINVLTKLANSEEGKRAGIELVGTSLSWAASRNLADEGGISAAAAIADFVMKLENGKIKLHHGTIVVVDEAGIVGSRDMHKILSAARTAGARVVLAGDTRQVSSVAAGGAFRAVIREKAMRAKNGVGAFTLDEVRRQEDKQDAEAGLMLSVGQAKEALAAYESMNRITIEANRDSALKAMFAAYLADHEKHRGGSQLMIAKTNRDVDELNAMAHQNRVESGLVGKTVQVAVKSGKGAEREMELGVGDLIQFRIKSKQVDVEQAGKDTQKDQVYNRTRARIELITGSGKEAELRVRIYEGDKPSNRIVTISGKDFRDGVLNLDYAYCMTIDSAQGQTFDRAYVMGAGFDRARAYVACSRHRKVDGLKIFGDLDTLHAAASSTYSNTEFVTRNHFTRGMAIESLAGMWSTEKVKKTTLDYRHHRLSEFEVAQKAARTEVKREVARVEQQMEAMAARGTSPADRLAARINEARNPMIGFGSKVIRISKTATALEINQVLIDAVRTGKTEIKLTGSKAFRRFVIETSGYAGLKLRFVDERSIKLIKEINDEQSGKRRTGSRAASRGYRPRQVHTTRVSQVASNPPRLDPESGRLRVHGMQKGPVAPDGGVQRQVSTNGARHKGVL